MRRCACQKHAKAERWHPSCIQPSTMESSHATVRTLTPLEGELAGVGPPRLLEDAQRAFAGGVTTLVIDLHRVSRLDARAGGLLARLAKQAPEHARLVLVGQAPAVRAITGALRLGEVFELHEDVAQVLKAAS